MRVPRTAAALFLCLVSVPGPVSAATTNIGAVAEINAGTLPDPITAGADIGTYTVQIGEAAGTYAVPAGYGVVTAWRHSTGTTPGDLAFKVYRPTGVAGQFLVLAADPRTAVAGTVHTFPVRIPVRPGDRIGISTTTVEVAYSTPDNADRMGVFKFDIPDPAVGSTAALDGEPFVPFKVDVSARIETDADRDGFGDDTQDACRTSAATQGACPVTRRYYPLPPGTVTPSSSFAGCAAATTHVIRGTPAANLLTGTSRGDRIFALAGNDSVNGLAGADCADLGAGADRGQGGAGGDLLLGGLGSDRISGDAGNDRIQGMAGNDRLSGGGGGDRVTGDAGADRLTGGSGADRLTGGSGRDRLTGGSGADRLSGGAGSDRISARDRKRDRISCGAGRDTVVADRVDRVARDCERVR